MDFCIGFLHWISALNFALDFALDLYIGFRVRFAAVLAAWRCVREAAEERASLNGTKQI